MTTEISTSPERLLLLDFSERERHELREQLLEAGYDVAIALDHADTCLKLLTWRPQGVIVDGDFASVDVTDLATLIRNSAFAPVSIVLLCQEYPNKDVSATVLLKPVTFTKLLGLLRGSQAD